MKFARIKRRLRPWRRQISLLAVVAVVGATGATLMTLTQANPFMASSEAESGIITLPAVTVADSTASGGSTVKFGMAPTPAPPAPPPTPPTSGGPRTCTNPVFQTSDRNGGWSNNGFYVHNNMWNSSATLGPETLYACAYNNWYVDSNQFSEAGAVKTYPNVHRDFNRPLSSFTTITSTYSHIEPNVPNGIWNFAYDVWMNDLNIEVMIWTDNYRQVPSGSRVATKNFGGHNYDIWRTNNNAYFAIVAQPDRPAGTVNIREMLDYLIAQGWLSPNVELYQIGYGVEIVSTNNQTARFIFNDFSLTAN